jgi:hypothetical protein
MELDITKSRKLVFGISIANVDVTNVKGKFVLYVTDTFQLVISTFAENGKLAVNIPPLDQYNLENGKYKAELWVIANRDYFTVPWTEEILIKKPISIKTKINMKEGSDPYVMVTKPVILKENL